MGPERLTVEPEPGQTVTVEPSPETGVETAAAAVALAETVAAGAELDASIRVAEHAGAVADVAAENQWLRSAILEQTDLSKAILARLETLETKQASTEVTAEIALETAAETLEAESTPPESSELEGLEEVDPAAIVSETSTSETPEGTSSETVTVALSGEAVESLEAATPAPNPRREKRHNWL